MRFANKWIKFTKKYSRVVLVLLALVSVLQISKIYGRKEEVCLKTKETNQQLYEDILRNYSRYVTHAPLANSTYQTVFLVLLKHDDYLLREQIRYSWANGNNSQLLKTSKATVLFLIGRGKNDTVIADYTFNDIIRVNVEENYSNLVYKELIAYLWLIDHFPSAYMVKVDGVDTAVNIDRFHKNLPANQKDVIVCITNENVRPKRNPCDKWYVSEKSWRNEYFPRYCNGPAYGLSIESLKKMIRVANRSQVFEVEDVFFTGVLAKVASVERMNVPWLIEPMCSTDMWSFLKNDRLACKGTEPTTAIVTVHRCEDSSLQYALQWLKSSKCSWF